MQKRREENEKLLTNPFVKATLETISKAEGTNGDYKKMVYGVVTRSPYFPQLIGKRNVTLPSLERFPNMLIKVNSAGLFSSAAGKYQILKKTYEAYAPKLGITDFSPHSQDLLAVELIRGRGNALSYIIKGDLQSALTKTSLPKEWASLAGAGYGQQERSLEALLAWFNSAHTTTAQAVKDNPNAAIVTAALIAGTLFF